jgi:amino-acid N-acetyltransferase
MKIKLAKISDAPFIYALINDYAEQDMMLFRSMTDIYENLRSFLLAEAGGRVVGCCSMQIIWSDLAEIKSLAVDKAHQDKGVGKMLVRQSVKEARKLGIKRVFALTLVPAFFKKLGFKPIDKEKLPMKVWTDCARCTKQDNCDEIAVIKVLK